MSSFVAANITISIYNVAWVIVMHICMACRIFPSDNGFKIILGIWLGLGAVIYASVLHYA